MDQEQNSAELPTYTDVDKVPINLLEQMSTHWKVLYAKRRKLHDVSVGQIVFGQVFTILVVGLASVFIEDNKEALLLIGTTLILYPSIADLLSSVGAVLSASVHHDIDTIEGNKILAVVYAVLRSIFVVLIASLLVGSVAGILGVWLFSVSFLQTLQLATLAGLLAGLVGFPVIIGVVFLARRLRANPDDVMPPLENTVFNALVLFAIVIGSRFLA